MKIRTQLVLACFFLAILPLAGIVLYSYETSRRALERAYRNEAARVTRQMDTRLKGIRSDLELRIAELSALPFTPAGGRPSGDVTDNVLAVLGDSAALIDAIEVQPVQGHAVHVAPAPPPPPDPGRAPATTVAEVRETQGDPSEGFVIDIPADAPMPRFRWTDAQRQKSREVGELSLKLARESATMTPEEREQLAQQLGKLQAEFAVELAAAREQFQREMDAAIKSRQQMEEARIDREEIRRQVAAATASINAASITGTRVDDPDATPAIPRVAATAPTSPTPQVAPVAATQAAPAPAPAPAVTMRRLDPKGENKKSANGAEKRVAFLFGQKFNVPVRRQGNVVANLSAQVRADEVISRVLGGGGSDDEIAFASDREGNLYTRSDKDRQRLGSLGITSASLKSGSIPRRDDWIVAVSDDRASGMKVGVARPIGNDLDDLRNTAGANFAAGIALIFVAMIGIIPVANHLSRDVKLVTAGAERIAQGDLMTRLPVTSKNEFGQLAAAFNKMAHDLSHHQQTIVEQERSRKEQEMQQKLLELEYERKTAELEEARRFQLSMLPKSIPTVKGLEVAVFTRTATEVGGDYYDFHVADDGVLAVAVGDATGHGAKAGTMVTVVKALFSSYAPSTSPAEFLSDSAGKIKRMDLGRMAMSLLVARFIAGEFVLSAAGMPPTLVHRAGTGHVDEIAIAGTPLGTLGSDYSEIAVPLSAGDTVLLMSDGLPELLDGEGTQFGYAATVDAFAEAARKATVNGVIDVLFDRVRAWRGDQAPNDDVTFVVVRAC